MFEALLYVGEGKGVGQNRLFVKPESALSLGPRIAPVITIVIDLLQFTCFYYVVTTFIEINKSITRFGVMFQV